MNRRPFWFFGLVVAFLSLAAGTIAESALACNTPPPPMNPPPPATVRPKTRTTYKITFRNYTTHGTAAGKFCGCGLKTLGVAITRINSVKIVFAGTNTAVPGFSFTPNPTTTAAFNSLRPGIWQGFAGQLTADVTAGAPTEMQFEAVAADGATPDDVAADLATDGAVGTAELNPDGSLAGTHQDVADVGEITQQRFAYVADNGSSNFTFYYLDATNGPLSTGPGSPFPAQGNPDALTFIQGPDGFDTDWFVVPNSPTSTVSVFSASRDTGALTPIGPPGPSGGTNCTDSSSFPGASFFDVFVQISHETSNNIVSHRLDRSTGALTQIQSVPTGPSPQKLATFSIPIELVSLHLASANCGSATCDGPGSVSVFSTNATTGLLTEVNGSPFMTGGIGTVWLAVDPTNQWLAAANARSNTITVFSIDQTAGSLTPAGPPVFSGGVGPSSVVFDPSGGFLIATNLLSSNGVVFAFDSTTGSLMQRSTYQTGTGPFSIRFGPGGNFFYTSNVIGGNVSGFAFDSLTGNATPTPGSPYPAGAGPIKIKIVDALNPID